MDKLLKVGVPVLVVLGLGTLGWLYLESSGKSGKAGEAATAMLNAADRVFDAATADKRFRENEEENFVNIGAIFTANGNVVATLIVSGSNGAEAICNRVAYVRDYMVGLFSDYPPDPRNLEAGPVGYAGSVIAGINELVDHQAVQRIRYDSYHLGQTGSTPSC